MTKKFFIRSSFAIAICLIFGFMGAVAFETGFADWYLTVKKPWFDLPDTLVSSIWIVMYIIIGIAAGKIWSKGFYHRWVKTALYHFGFLLILNGFWFLLFYVLNQAFLSLLNISALLVFIIITIRWFRIVNTTAAYLLLPYGVWILFVAALNFEIWRLN